METMEGKTTKERLLEAAKKVFAEKGYHAAGVSDIIEAAGVARGTFYLYFKSKRDVFTALVEYIIQKIDSLVTPLPMDTPEQILPRLKETLLKVYGFFDSDRDLAALIIREATSLDAQSWESLNEAVALLSNWIASYIERGQRLGVLCRVNPKILSFTFLGALREMLLQYAITGFLDSELEEMTETLLEVFLFGVLEDKYRIIVAKDKEDEKKRRAEVQSKKGGES
ncbi:MAG TPA: TetR/AcrR family transcriptional regulator [Proteobacteria bacterium]|nr:TetR/AcrR family transcriptional regulator [Pseudomonadota bacterium]